MPRYEYKIIPAPEKASKIKGLKSPERFAATLEQAMNDLGADGWHYLRADTLPQEERSGLTSRTTTYRNLLVFCRELPDVTVDVAPTTVPKVAPEPPVADPEPEATADNIFDLDEGPDTPDTPAPTR